MAVNCRLREADLDLGPWAFRLRLTDVEVVEHGIAAFLQMNSSMGMNPPADRTRTTWIGLPPGIACADLADISIRSAVQTVVLQSGQLSV